MTLIEWEWYDFIDKKWKHGESNGNTKEWFNDFFVRVYGIEKADYEEYQDYIYYAPKNPDNCSCIRRVKKEVLKNDWNI